MSKAYLDLLTECLLPEGKDVYTRITKAVCILKYKSRVPRCEPLLKDSPSSRPPLVLQPIPHHCETDDYSKPQRSDRSISLGGIRGSAKMAKNDDRIPMVNWVYDLMLWVMSVLIDLFFREVHPRGSWRVPRRGPVLFVAAPHANQVGFHITLSHKRMLTIH